MSPGAQKMKTGPDALGTAEKVFGAQNKKTAPDALGTDKNESGRAKHENGTRRPRYGRKRVRACKTRKQDPSPSVPTKTSLGAQNIKKGPDALATAKNESGHAKYENET
jgi:hypothetical protein